MPADQTASEDTTSRAATATATEKPLTIGDTLTVVSGRLGGSWVVEDEEGVVYLATPVE